MDRGEIRRDGTNWDTFDSVQASVTGSYEHRNETSGFINGGKVLDYQVIISFSRRNLLYRVSYKASNNALVM
jgi:hypothetical protein